MKRYFTLSIMLLMCSGLFSQNTVGLLSYDISKSYDGYNLIYPFVQSTVFLVNNCGEVVHSWTDTSDVVAGATAYLLDDGRLVKTKRPRSGAGDFIFFPGAGATVEIRDWDNNLEWSYTLNDSTARLHHDIEVLPNGNILMIAWEPVTVDEAIAAGRDTTGFTTDYFWPEYIFEINPETDETVWEWRVWDHLIQDFDDTKANFGVVSDHPERFNLNFDTDGVPNWMHFNAIDYDQENDMILLSSPFHNELYIIDHTTTTQEAASSSGGLSGVGGDLMWRWGNNVSFNVGTSDDQQIFFSHDANYVDDPWIDQNDPMRGRIAVFNNRAGADFSLVNVINTGFDMYEYKFPFDEGKWGPDNFSKTVVHPDTAKMYSDIMSSAQYLPNGNFLIGVGRHGYCFEVTPDKKIVWEYKVPLRGTTHVNQGDTLNINDNLTFRVKRYPPEYDAFTGRDLSSKGWIEMNPDSSYCDELTATIDIPAEFGLEITPNPGQDLISISWKTGENAEFEIVNSNGFIMMSAQEFSGGRKYLDTTSWPNGLYFIRINRRYVEKLIISR